MTLFNLFQPFNFDKKHSNYSPLYPVMNLEEIGEDIIEEEVILSYKEIKIALNKNKRYIIYKYTNSPKDNKFKNLLMTTKRLHINFKKGDNINTKINIYYDKENIKLENKKFIDSDFEDDLYHQKTIYFEEVKSQIIYIIISIFQNDIYEDTMTVFNNMEYFDISKIGQFRFDYYSILELCYQEYITLSIYNINLDYSYLHFEYIGSIIYFITEEGEKIIPDVEYNYLSLKEYKNKRYIFWLFLENVILNINQFYFFLLITVLYFLFQILKKKLFIHQF